MASLDGDEGCLPVDGPDPRHLLEIDHEGVRARQDSSAHTAAGPEGDERDALPRCPAYEQRELVRGLWPCDRTGLMPGGAAGANAEVMARPQVAAVRQAIGFVDARAERGQGISKALQNRHP